MPTTRKQGARLLLPLPAPSFSRASRRKRQQKTSRADEAQAKWAEEKHKASHHRRLQGCFRTSPHSSEPVQQGERQVTQLSPCADRAEFSWPCFCIRLRPRRRHWCGLQGSCAPHSSPRGASLPWPILCLQEHPTPLSCCLLPASALSFYDHAISHHDNSAVCRGLEPSHARLELRYRSVCHRPIFAWSRPRRLVNFCFPLHLVVVCGWREAAWHSEMCHWSAAASLPVRSHKIDFCQRICCEATMSPGAHL